MLQSNLHQPKTVRSSASGFTLIELLIAISILSMLLTTATYSYSLISSRWQNVLDDFVESANEAKHIDLLYQVVSGVQSFVVRDSAQSPAFFFVGNENRLLGVSQYGIYSDVPEVFRLIAVKKENNKYDLIHQSRSTNGFLLTSSSQTISFSKSLVLFEDLDAVQFEYFGWRHVYEKTDDEGNGYKPMWVSKYSGIDARYMPSKIRVALVKEQKKLAFTIGLQADVENWLAPYSDSDT